VVELVLEGLAGGGTSLEVLLDALQLHEHGLYLDLVVLAEVGDLALEVVELSVLELLALDEEDGVVERPPRGGAACSPSAGSRSCTPTRSTGT